jgi:hypothetical protein
MQLVSDSVHLLDPFTGKRWGPEEVLLLLLAAQGF